MNFGFVVAERAKRGLHLALNAIVKAFDGIGAEVSRFLVPLKAQVDEDVCAHIVIHTANLDGDVGACERACNEAHEDQCGSAVPQSLHEGIALRHQ